MKKFTVLSIMFILCIMLAALAGCGADKAEQQRIDNLNRGACQDNLRTMDGAIMTYSAATGGGYPRSIDQMVPQYIKAAPTCPAGGIYSLTSTTPPRAVCSAGHTY